jgi:putative peptidoglycan lipid II flippase
MSHDLSRFSSGVRVTAFWTMVSRLLGMVRDVATAALFGLVGGGVIDAFVIAFRVPNLFRRLFGEGALAASYLPVITGALERDRRSAWQLVSVLLGGLAMLLATVVFCAETFCLIVWFGAEDRPEIQLVAGLSAVMLPYLLFLCLAALVSGTLHALNHFSTPAFVPVILNVFWIVAAVGVAPHWSGNQPAQAYIIAAAVLLGGLLQFTVQLPILRRLGFRFDYNWQASRQAVRRVVSGLLPTSFGLAILQLNTLVDTAVAWFFSSPAPGSPIAWLGGAMDYPMREGTIGAIYFSERLYELPVGLLGVAIGTVIFPALSRHASRGAGGKLAADLTLGLRLTLFLAIPASVGLILLAEPVTTLLFRHGAFTPFDAARTAGMVAAYASGIWAYCALPILIRGFYAAGDHQTPWRLGAQIVLLNLLLDIGLIWHFSENGLALASAIAASLFAILLTIQVGRRIGPLGWQSLGVTLARSTLSSLAMLVAGAMILGLLPAVSPTDSLWAETRRVALPLASCLIIYLAISTTTGGLEWRLLAERKPEKH